MTVLASPAVAAEIIAIRPGPPLTGTVSVDGSKNAALPLLAAAALLGCRVTLDNVPASSDVQTMLTLIQYAGRRMTGEPGNPDRVTIGAANAPVADAEFFSLAAGIRASYYLVPVLLTAFGRAVMPWPGGCRIGERGMEQHFTVYEAFGDRWSCDEVGYVVEAGRYDSGSVSLVLPFRSRGATIAAVLRAAACGRPLRLGRPNLSCEVFAVLEFLRACGWEFQAVEHELVLLPPATGLAVDAVTWRVPGDKIEAGTLACAVAASCGTARVEGVKSDDVAPAVAALRELGVPVDCEPNAIVVQAEDIRPTHRSLRAHATLAPGGLDADFEPSLMAVALGLPGTHLFADSINPGRHGNLVPQLIRMGAAIDQISATECRVTGPQRLTGAGVETTDIRTGSALLIAGLAARGITTLGGLEQLRRGHADLPTKLRSLGADICEVTP